MSDNIETRNRLPSGDIGLNEYIITPKYKNSLFEEGFWTKLFGDTLVKVKITQVWRMGKFIAEVYDNEVEDMRNSNELVVNDYGAEVYYTSGECSREIEIENITSYTDNVKTAIYATLFKDVDNCELLSTSEIEEMNEWSLHDTHYRIIGGANIVMKEGNEESESERESECESEEESEEFNICKKCNRTNGVVWCFRCDTSNICETCDGSGGDYGENEEWVCNNCLPRCLHCDKKLFVIGDECCGKGRSDMTMVILEDNSTTQEPVTILVDSSPDNSTNIFYTCAPDSHSTRM